MVVKKGEHKSEQKQKVSELTMEVREEWTKECEGRHAREHKNSDQEIIDFAATGAKLL